MAITAQRYTFRCFLVSEARLPGYLGSTLRGALGWALKNTSCALRRQQCASCLLRATCSHAWIFETEPYQAGDGRMVNARPHPFVLDPGRLVAGTLPAGAALDFSLLLLDRANELLPQIVYAVRLMGESGIGSGRRDGLGRFKIGKIIAGEEVLYSEADQVLRNYNALQKISLAAPEQRDIQSIKVVLETPLRMKKNNRLGLELPFHVLIRACLRRIAALEAAYGGGEPELDYSGLVRRAEKIETAASTIHWRKLFRWSERQRKKVSLGGLAGAVTYRGDLDEFLPLLRYAEQVNIGKQTVFGLGKMSIEQTD